MKKSNLSRMFLAIILSIIVMIIIFIMILTYVSKQKRIAKNEYQLSKWAKLDSIAILYTIKNISDSLISNHFWELGRKDLYNKQLMFYDNIRTEVGNEGTIYNLIEARISFKTPETMKVAETRTVELLMSKREPILQLSNLIKKQISEPGKIHEDTVKISTKMEASLTGQGFLINAITPVMQLASGFAINIWKWEVTARETGEKKLHLTLNALISIGKNEELHTIRTYERTVIVYVRLGDKILAFLDGNWQFLFGAIVSPLVIYFWKRITGRKKNV